MRSRVQDLDRPARFHGRLRVSELTGSATHPADFPEEASVRCEDQRRTLIKQQPISTHPLPLRTAEPITFKPRMAFGFPILYPREARRATGRSNSPRTTSSSSRSMRE
jgi:hypothetical protein